ncbi:10136_t:CDS:2, partial [Funneliformis geosporum]
AFRALRLSLQELDKYYGNIPQICHRETPLFSDLKLTQSEESEEATTYKAILQADKNAQDHLVVYVKAVQRKYYSLQAQNILYENGRHAPGIIDATDRPGGWLLVYMERLQNHVTLDKFTHTLDNSERDTLKAEIIRLIDFEWSGAVGTACYSHFMNHIAIRWPEGAEDGKKVTVEHNIMLEKTFQKTNLSQDSMLVD